MNILNIFVEICVICFLVNDYLCDIEYDPVKSIECNTSLPMSLVRFFDFKLYLGPGVLRHLGSDPASLGYYVLNSLGEVD